MSDIENNQQTPYDEMVQTKELQMLKTIVPYINPREQNQMVLMIQLLQFRHTYRLMNQGNARLSAASLPEGADRRTAMLNDLRPFCNPKEQDLIDNLINMFTILDNRDLFNS